MSNPVENVVTYNNIFIQTDETTVDVSQPVTNIVQINALGPQGATGLQGPQGPVGSIFPYTGSAAITGSLTVTGSVNATSFTGSLQWSNITNVPTFATTGSNTFSGTQTINSDLIISQGNKVYINGGAIPSFGISSYTDPVNQMSSDGQFSGETIKGIAGENINLGELIYLYTDGLWYRADATPDGTNGASSAISLLGILVGSANAQATNPIVVLLQGIVYTTSIQGSEALGIPLWVSIGAGNMRDTAPTSTGNVVRQVGHIIASHIVRFTPDNYYSIV
jgi:hypothetical protein